MPHEDCRVRHIPAMEAFSSDLLEGHWVSRYLLSSHDHFESFGVTFMVDSGRVNAHFTPVKYAHPALLIFRTRQSHIYASFACLGTGNVCGHSYSLSDLRAATEACITDGEATMNTVYTLENRKSQTKQVF